MQNMMTMVMVSDMDRSVRFYRGTLGLKLRDKPSPTGRGLELERNVVVGNGAGGCCRGRGAGGNIGSGTALGAARILAGTTK